MRAGPPVAEVAAVRSAVVRVSISKQQRVAGMNIRRTRNAVTFSEQPQPRCLRVSVHVLKAYNRPYEAASELDHATGE